MATLLGDSSNPTTQQEWFGANSHNQHAQALTLPPGGPWSIVTLGAWFAGKDTSVTAYLVVWNSTTGVILGQSTSFTAASRSFGLGQNDNYERAVTAPPSIAGGTTVYVGFSRNASGAAQLGTRGGGNTHYDDTDPNSPATLVSGTLHATGDMGAYLYYQASNTAPNAPTLNDPTGGELVASTTPTLNFTPSDPDGDVHTGYHFQVATGSDFSGLVQSEEPTGSFTNGVAINQVFTNGGARGMTYYWRVRTKDAANGYGNFSAGASFRVAQLPTASVTTPANGHTARLYFTAGAAGNPKIRAFWSYNCPDGHAQSEVLISIFADLAGSPGATLNTDQYIGTATNFNTTYAVTEGTYYHISVQPKCSMPVQGVASAKNRCRTRWSRASYFFDSGSVPTTLGVASDITGGSNRIAVIEYTATASTTEPTTWYSSVSSAGLARYFWHRVTMVAWGSTPTSPKVNSVTWSYSANALTLDNWTMASGASVDLGTYVYGTQSVKHATNGALQETYQSIKVTPNTQIILSGRIRTLGQPNALIGISNGITSLVSVTATADTDWILYSTAAIDTGSSTELYVVLDTNATAGASAWFDAIKIEASTVVTPWSPGFVGPAVVLDAGGVQVDAQAGGVFRLKDSIGQTKDLDDIVALGAGAKAYANAAQSIPDATETAVALNQEEWDTDGYHDNATNNSRFTVPSGRAGKYRLTGAVNLDASTSPVRAVLFWRLNGTTTIRLEVSWTPSSTQRTGTVVVAEAILAVGDYVELVILQDSSGAVGIGHASFTGLQSFGCVSWIGP